MESELLSYSAMSGRPIVPRRQHGFTMVELLVVVGIIAVMSAVALPNVVNYTRGMRIRSAGDELASAIQRARNTAITRNTQNGIVFITQSPSRYWVHVEDTLAGSAGAGEVVGFTRQGVDFAAPNPARSTRYDLPTYVRFAANAAECPGAVPGYVPNQTALRFDRYGVPRVPGVNGQPGVIYNGASVAVNLVSVPAAGDATVCLIDTQTGFRRWVQISTSGRIVRR